LRLSASATPPNWATQTGTELDFPLNLQGRRYGVEIKYSDTPSLTKSMKIAFDDLGLNRLYVVYPGQRHDILDKRIEALPLGELLAEIEGRRKRWGVS
jgi:predicted AAA+ superfamily ATPase